MLANKLNLNITNSDKERAYNSIPFRVLSDFGLPTNYYLLTPEQKDFISDLFSGFLGIVKTRIQNYNDDNFNEKYDINYTE